MQAPVASIETFDSLAERFMDFCDSFGEYFQVARHNSVDKARCYVAGLMMKAERKNMERMEEYVEDYDYQAQQQFLSDSPWGHEELIKRIGKETGKILGGKDSVLLIDESCFAKKGTKSVGVSRQWNGRLGKVDNSQVAVFAALSDGFRCSPTDVRLYLPHEWTQDSNRCDAAKIPKEQRDPKSKIELAWDMIEAAQSNGIKFGWVGLDALYGNAPSLLRKIDTSGLRFAADVHCDQTIYIDDPTPYLPAPKGGRGRPCTQLRSNAQGERIDSVFDNISDKKWCNVFVREGTKGPINVMACRSRVWLWDGKEKQAKQWWAVCFIDNDTGEKKFFLSNAPVNISLIKLIRKHALRYWIERSFQDAKTSVGMADYQARGWIPWHHHIALVMLAMLFLLRERKVHENQIELLSCQDIVALLDVYLARTDRTKEAVIRNMNRRHAKRRTAIEFAQKKAKLNPRI